MQSKKAGPKTKLSNTSPTSSSKAKETKVKKPPRVKKETSKKNITTKESKKDELEKKRKAEENAEEPKQKRGRRPKTKTVRADLSDAEQGLKQSNITALFAKKKSEAKVQEKKSQQSAKNVAESAPSVTAAKKAPAATSLPKKPLEKPDPTADVDKLLQQISEYNEDVKTEPVDEEEVIRGEIAENNKRIEELNAGLKNAFELFCVSIF